MKYSPYKSAEGQACGHEFIWNGRGHCGHDAGYGILGCPYIKAGRRVLYRKSDFAVWAASQLRTSTSDRGSGQDRTA